ncbi:MAG: DEAD/DEAH box helicase [bacterium]
MQLDDLGKWGLSPRIIDVWRRRQGDGLLPVQSRAVRSGLLGPTGSATSRLPVRMIIAAPTSAGKSFCAEMAAARELMARRKTVMLFPLKALAEQKYEHFKKTLGRLGVRGLICSGDYPENDRRFYDGDYQMAYAIYEKFDKLLTRNLDILSNIGLVVVDELQMIGDASRGAVLERLLTKILASVYEPSLIALSAVIGDNSASARQLAQWLGATLVEESHRPVDLLRGVAAEGSFRYRSYNSGLDGQEPFALDRSSPEPFDSLIEHIKGGESGSIVFLKSRHDTIQAALRLAQAVSWPPAKTTLTQLADEEPSMLLRSLRQVLKRGVAFHNSDLPPSQRKAIENGFAQEEIKVIVSTTTLSMGVDLPASHVYLETVKYVGGEYGGRPSLTPVTRAEFDNMTGRAGRLRPGREIPVGRAVVVAETEFDRDVLWNSYIGPDQPEPITSALTAESFEDWLLDVIVAGLVRGPDEIATLMGRTFLSRSQPELTRLDFDKTLGLLVDEQLVRISDEGVIAPGELGRQAALSGLSLRQVSHCRRMLRRKSPRTLTGWLGLVLSGPQWTPPSGLLTAMEFADGNLSSLIPEQIWLDLEEIDFLICPDKLPGRLSWKTAAAFKALLILQQWSQLHPVSRLEERFRIHLGQILSLGEAAGHFLGGLSLLIAATDRKSEHIARLQELAFTVHHGLPARFRQVHSYFGSHLTRQDFQRFEAMGLDSLQALAAASDSDIQAALQSNDKIEVFNDILSQVKEEVDMRTKSTIGCGKAAVPLHGEPRLIEIDGGYEGERYLIRIDGFPVRLTGKSFKYFVRLAWSRLHSEGGWIYKEDLEVGLNQARYVYRMKNEINAEFQSTWSIVGNNRLGFYRLDIDPSRIKINQERLKEHPDYEVSCLVASGQSRPEHRPAV